MPSPDCLDVKSMRIVQIGKFYPPENGGIETVTADLAEGFARRGWRSEVVAFTKKASEDVVVKGVRIIRKRYAALLSSQPLGIAWIMAAVRQARSTDVAIIHAPNLMGGIVSPFLGRTKAIVYWHSDIINKGVLGWLAKPLETIMLRRADQIWVTSEIYAAGSQSIAPYSDKIRLLPIGIQDAATGPRQDLSDEVAAFLRGRRFALSVGRLVPYKGFADLIRAAALLPSDQAIVIAGGGPLQRELAARIEESGMQDRIMLTGRVSDALLRALFAHATLFVLPSNQRSEAYGVVLLEAMAFGLPIVATDIPGSGVSWVAGEGALGPIVPVGSPEALAEAIGRLFDGDDDVALRQRSRARFVDRFRAEDMVDRAIALVR